MNPVESGGPGHELCFEKSCGEWRWGRGGGGVCKRLPGFFILSFSGLDSESPPPCFISITALVKNGKELLCLLVEGWPVPLALSPRLQRAGRPV